MLYSDCSLTTAGIMNKGLYTSLTCEWETPKEFYEGLDAEFHFSLDVCAGPGNTQCAEYLSSGDMWSALIKPWVGVCWCNPPYGREIGQWMRKAYESSRRGATVVCLIPSRTDTRWWHDWVMKADEIRFIKGRLHFSGSGPAPFPSAIVVFRSR